MRVLAIDPGGTTGWAFADVELDGGSMIIQTRQSLVTGQIQGHDTEERTWKIIELIGSCEPDIVLVEDFVLFVWKKLSMAREQIEPHAINANLRFIWWLAKHNDEPLWGADEIDLPRLVFQMPGERKEITDKMLKGWKLWRTPSQSGGQHAMDALRHLLVYLKRVRSNR